MTSQFQEILEELYEDDPNLKLQESKLIQGLEMLKSFAPSPDIDQSYKADLKRTLLENLPQSRSKTPSLSFAYVFTALFSTVGFLVFGFFVFKEVYHTPLDTYQTTSSEIATDFATSPTDGAGMNIRSSDASKISGMEGNSASDGGIMDAIGKHFSKENTPVDIQAESSSPEAGTSEPESPTAQDMYTSVDNSALQTMDALMSPSPSEAPTSHEDTLSKEIISPFDAGGSTDTLVGYTYAGPLSYPPSGQVYKLNNDTDQLLSTLGINASDAHLKYSNDDMMRFSKNEEEFEIHTSQKVLNIYHNPLTQSATTSGISLTQSLQLVQKFFDQKKLPLTLYLPPSESEEYSGRIQLFYQLHLNGSKVYDVKGNPVGMRVTLDPQSHTILSVKHYCYATPLVAENVNNIPQSKIIEVLNKGGIQNLSLPQSPKHFESLTHPELAYVAYLEPSSGSFEALYPALSFQKPKGLIIPLSSKVYQFDAQGNIIDMILTK